MGEGPNLEYTPTWVVAITSIFIILISWMLERALHHTGKLFKRKKLENMYGALQKIKEELMIMGFISLLLAVFQGAVQGWCIEEKLSGGWLPCHHKSPVSTTSHFQRFLAESSSDSASSGNCKPGKVPFMSLKALHDLHIFIFVLAVVQVIITVLTFAAGGYKISRWSKWESAILKEIDENEGKEEVVMNIQNDDFFKNRFWGVDSYFRGWVFSFFKHISGSITESDYKQLRKGFIMKHCKGNPRFNFHSYMLRAFELDFKHIVGINWYLWIFVVLLLFLNVAGWLTYFVLSFIPLILLLVIGTKLEHIITQLAVEFASKNSVYTEVEIKPSDDFFWFKKPRILLILIHLIIFANSFEIAIFFWALVNQLTSNSKHTIYCINTPRSCASFKRSIYMCVCAVLCMQVTYKIHSCFIGSVAFLVPRLVIVVLVQFFGTYSTLPLYAIVTQMGSSFSIAIFGENVQENLRLWTDKAKAKKTAETSSHVFHAESSPSTPLRHQNLQPSPSFEIQPAP